MFLISDKPSHGYGMDHQQTSEFGNFDFSCCLLCCNIRPVAFSPIGASTGSDFTNPSVQSCGRMTLTP